MYLLMGLIQIIMLIQDDFYYSFLFIDEIQEIVEEEFYTKRNGLFR